MSNRGKLNYVSAESMLYEATFMLGVNGGYMRHPFKEAWDLPADDFLLYEEGRLFGIYLLIKGHGLEPDAYYLRQAWYDGIFSIEKRV